MRSEAAASAAAAVASMAPVAQAANPQPVAFTAGNWLGIDGNWSTASFLVGSNSDPVNVLVDTTLSEFWTIGPSGCAQGDTQCESARGGIFNPGDSKHWSGLGNFGLGLHQLGYGGVGQYGFDSISSYSPITKIGFHMTNVLISAINKNDFYQGYFGLGIQSGSFGEVVPTPPLRQAVQSFGWIPSYSYGFTAGASYRDMVMSATLGGTDTARYIPHETEFNLIRNESVPRPMVRGIEVYANNSESAPASWSSDTEILSGYDSAFTAVIDSSTPYLWLPEPLCDQFAKTLNLTYNETFGLYTISNDQYNQYTADDSLGFTFSLSSYDNRDNFGQPLDVPGVVNISLPIRSFVSRLQFPFANGTIKYGDPAVPYFTLRKAFNNTALLGRAFLQESYLITKYDSGVFSVHQAKFPSDPIGGAQLAEIKQPPGSSLPGPPSPKKDNALSTGQMVGIAVGVVVFCALLITAFLCFRRRRRARRDKARDELDDGKDSTSTLTPDSPRTPVARILSRIGRRKRSRRAGANTVHGVGVGGAVNPSEAPDCQIYELPAPVPPAELDAGGSDDNSILGDTELGTDNSQNLSAYELARRKLDRQLQGPVPEYSPPADGSILPPEKTSIPDLSPTDQNAATDQPSPISPTRSRGADSNSNTFQGSEPSPVSPRGVADWNSADPPSPVTGSMPPRSHSSGTRSRGHSTVSRSQSVNSTLPVSPLTDTMPGFPSSFQRTTVEPVPALPSAYQRAPIDPSKVVCLGPLPENVQLPQAGASSAANRTEGKIIPSGMFNATTSPSEGSLGSNFTEEEAEMTRHTGAPQIRHNQAGHESISSRLNDSRGQQRPSQGSKTDGDSDSSSESRRMNPVFDLVHVPQMADKRYSWEVDG